MANQLYTVTSPSWNGSLNTKFVDIISPSTSFSGTDIVVSFAFDDSRAVTVGTLATMTYSVYREKRQVRTLGRVSMRGVTKGPMTVAGTLIFSVINQHVVNDIRNAIAKGNSAHPLANVNLKRLRMDELPPFDIILTFGNEYGQSAKMVIYGVTITDEAMTFSIEDMFTENVMTYMARDIETMRGPWSKDMGLYVDTGTSLGGGQQLPKYGFDVSSLWNQTLDVYQERVKALVDKANRDYGSSYTQPNYSGIPQLPAGPPAPSASGRVVQTGTVSCNVVTENGVAVRGVGINATYGVNKSLKVSDWTGIARWDNVPAGTTVLFEMPPNNDYTLVKAAPSVSMPQGATVLDAIVTSTIVVRKIIYGVGGNTGSDIPSTDPPKIQLTITDTKGNTIPGVTVKIQFGGFDSGTGNSASNSKGQITYENVAVGNMIYTFVPQDSSWKVVSGPGEVTLDSSWAGKIRKIAMTLSK